MQVPHSGLLMFSLDSHPSREICAACGPQVRETCILRHSAVKNVRGREQQRSASCCGSLLMPTKFRTWETNALPMTWTLRVCVWVCVCVCEMEHILEQCLPVVKKPTGCSDILFVYTFWHCCWELPDGEAQMHRGLCGALVEPVEEWEEMESRLPAKWNADSTSPGFSFGLCSGFSIGCLPNTGPQLGLHPSVTWEPL